MPTYTITDAAKEIVVIMPDGKRVVIRPNDEIVRKPVIIFPEDRKGGEFTSDEEVALPIIGSERRKDKRLILLEDNRMEIGINYAPGGKGEKEPLITIRR